MHTRVQYLEKKPTAMQLPANDYFNRWQKPLVPNLTARLCCSAAHSLVAEKEETARRNLAVKFEDSIYRYSTLVTD